MNMATPLYWLIEIETYDFAVGAFRGADLSGKALILSSQLWSIIRGAQVYSILIGPGIFKGVATKGGIHVDVQEYISCLMFDPTQLRYDEPLPQVDIVSPEVIDPLGVRKQEEIVTIIRNLVIERGNILAGDTLATENCPKLSRQQTERTRVLATPFFTFTGFTDIEIMSDWMIVEKAGQDSKTGMEAIAAEYEWTLGVIEKDQDKYIFEL